MGAWSYGVFDDDTAYDALADLKASADIIVDMEKYFDEVIQAESVGFDEAHYALVSAAVIDSVINDIHHRCDEDDYFEWTKSLKHLDFSSVRHKAVQAIDAVLSDNSELRELWEENAELYGAWREDKLSIQKRLQKGATIMSYDLMVFEKVKAPATKKEFMAWYEKQTEWGEDHDYETISVTSPALQNWFMEMKETFPPMNGEYAPAPDLLAEDENLESHLVDYCIGRDVIYAAFAWSVAEEAYELMRRLAQKHNVGFYGVSEDDNIILPDGTVIV